jgi:hypothetical protein
MNNQSKGLLSNIQSISAAKYFTSNMSINEAAQMTLNKSYVYKEAVNDANTLGEDITNYLSRIYNASAEFISSDVLWERKELMNILEKTVSSEIGMLMCVLGGKSTGKSFLLKKIESIYPENVFIINMRSYKDIVPGLINVIKRRLDEKNKNVTNFVDTFEAVTDTLSGGMFKPINELVRKKLRTYVDTQGNDSSIKDALERLLGFVDKVTIVIDEANLALTFDENDHVKKKEAKFFAAVMTLMTKEEKKVF